MGKKSRLKKLKRSVSIVAKSPADKEVSARPRSALPENQARCGLCGKTGRLTRTECCGNWICDDEDQYIPFSFVRNSCHRNHARYTLCGYHYIEGHSGDWKDCPDCRRAFPTELYVYRGTNEYNFEKFSNPPDFEPTTCVNCGAIIRLGKEGYSHGPEGYKCEKCTHLEFPYL